METMFHSRKSLRQWYRRVLMVPVIDGCMTVDRKSDLPALAELRPCLPKRILMKREAFVRKFYS